MASTLKKKLCTAAELPTSRAGEPNASANDKHDIVAEAEAITANAASLVLV